MFAVAILAAGGWCVTKLGLAYFDPVSFMLLRFLLAGVVISTFFVSRLDISAVKQSLIPGLIMGVALVMWVFGVDTAEQMGMAGFLITAGIVLSPIYSHLFFNDPLRRSYWGKVFVSLLGAGLMAPEFSIDSFFLFLSAAILLGVHLSVQSHRSKSIDLRSYSAGQFFAVGAVFCVAFTFYHEKTSVPDVGIVGWALVCLSATIFTAFRFVLQVLAQKYLTHQDSSFILNLECVFLILFSVILWGETYALSAILGALCVVAVILPYRKIKTLVYSDG
jgi:drug/metabolite transporter (DMT)-like permease